MKRVAAEIVRHFGRYDEADVHRAVQAIAASGDEPGKQYAISVFEHPRAESEAESHSLRDWDHFYQLEDGRVEMHRDCAERGSL